MIEYDGTPRVKDNGPSRAKGIKDFFSLESRRAGQAGQEKARLFRAYRSYKKK